MTTARVSDAAFEFNEVEIEAVAKRKPWLSDPMFFNKVMLSASAAMKMLRHAQSGVEAGLARPESPMPIEIMGLMIGHLDPGSPRTIIVTDVFPLPVEGSETRVVADSEDVQGYMAQLSDSLEKTRKERLCGWYHSHPFEVGENSNCFFSAVDVQTQLTWQLAFERVGDPYVGIVVDPLRSLAKGRPELAAFHCYPPDYTPPKGKGPDGIVYPDDSALQERWGPAAKSYYMLETEIFMSSLSKMLVDILSRDFMWTRVLGTTPGHDRESREALTDRLASTAAKLRAAEPRGDHGVLSVFRASASAGSGGAVKASDLGSCARVLADVATEQLRGEASQVAKFVVFNTTTDVRDTLVGRAESVTTSRSVAAADDAPGDSARGAEGGGGGGGSAGASAGGGGGGAGGD